MSHIEISLFFGRIKLQRTNNTYVFLYFIFTCDEIPDLRTKDATTFCVQDDGALEPPCVVMTLQECVWASCRHPRRLRISLPVPQRCHRSLALLFLTINIFPFLKKKPLERGRVLVLDQYNCTRLAIPASACTCYAFPARLHLFLCHIATQSCSITPLLAASLLSQCIWQRVNFCNHYGRIAGFYICTSLIK